MPATRRECIAGTEIGRLRRHWRLADPIGDFRLSFIGAIDCKPEPMVEQIVGVLVGGRGSYVRNWKIVRLYPFDKFKLGAVRHKFVVAI
jgi:hypothetical protein